MVGGVRNVEVARTVHNNTFGCVERRRGGRAAIAVEAAHPRAGDGRNVPGRGVHLADAVVPSVRNVEVARTVQRNPRGEVELRCRGRAAIAAEQPGAGERFDYRDPVVLRRQRRCGDGNEKPQRDPPAQPRRQRQQAGEGQAEELEQRAKKKADAPAGAARAC